MTDLPRPPAIHKEFTKRYAKLGRAWELIAEQGAEGPLNAETTRLVKLGIAIGAMREGAVHSCVRKALAQDISVEALEQVVALAAGTMGMPSTVAAYSWIKDVTDPE